MKSTDFLLEKSECIKTMFGLAKHTEMDITIEAPTSKTIVYQAEWRLKNMTKRSAWQHKNDSQ